MTWLGEAAILERFWADLVARTDGPLRLRFVLQPLVACLLAARAGRRDAREGRAPFLWAFLREPGQRGRLAREAWGDIGRVVLVAILLDAIYQIAFLDVLRPGETLAIALLLAVLPYALLRGPVTRALRRRRRGDQSGIR